MCQTSWFISDRSLYRNCNQFTKLRLHNLQNRKLALLQELGFFLPMDSCKLPYICTLYNWTWLLIMDCIWKSFVLVLFTQLSEGLTSFPVKATTELPLAISGTGSHLKWTLWWYIKSKEMCSLTYHFIYLDQYLHEHAYSGSIKYSLNLLRRFICLGTGQQIRIWAFSES